MYKTITYQDAMDNLKAEADRLYNSDGYPERTRGEKYKVAWQYLLNNQAKAEQIPANPSPRKIKAKALGPAVEKLRAKWPKKSNGASARK